MSMEMTLNQKIEKVSNIINETRTIQGTNPVFIPISRFSKDDLGFSNARDIFRVLQEQGALEKIEKWWGYEEVRGKKNVFVKTSSDEAKTEDDYEAYEISVNEKKLHNRLPINPSTKNEVEFDSQNGVIFFGKIRHVFQKGRDGQLRLKLFRILWDKRMVSKNGKSRPKGELFPASAIAVQLEFIDSPRIFDKDFETKDRLDNLLKNTERTLQEKGIPIRLYQKGGVQIVIEL